MDDSHVFVDNSDYGDPVADVSTNVGVAPVHHVHHRVHHHHHHHAGLYSEAMNVPDNYQVSGVNHMGGYVDVPVEHIAGENYEGHTTHEVQSHLGKILD